VGTGPLRTSRPPERTCIVTRKPGAPGDMLRFVAGPDGHVVVDIKRRLPGRGVWTGLNRALVAEAVKRRLFARGLGEQVAAAGDLPAIVDDLLERDVIAALALANKAGLARIGFDKAGEALRSGKAAALIEAGDAGGDGSGKLSSLARGGGIPVAVTVEAERLGAAFGRSRTAHVALMAGGAAVAALAAVERLARYRQDEGRRT
jgi:hypothetical protein